MSAVAAKLLPGMIEAVREPVFGVQRPRLLDLFCCAGGAGMGYSQAGFGIVGADLVVHRANPFPVMQTDALSVDPAWVRANFDAIHASPICQGDTVLRHAPGTKQHPDLIPPTIELLERIGLPYVLENVVGARAKLRDPTLLCGSMFGLGAQGCYLERHRLFMTNWPLTAPGPCKHEGPCIGVYGAHARRRSAAAGGRGTRDIWEGGHRAAASEAMGIDWMNLAELSEAIPPAFTRHIGVQLLAHLRLRAAA